MQDYDKGIELCEEVAKLAEENPELLNKKLSLQKNKKLRSQMALLREKKQRNFLRVLKEDRPRVFAAGVLGTFVLLGYLAYKANKQ